MYDWSVAFLLAVWLVCSVAAQRNLSSKVLTFDVLGLIPNCHFFAPKPVSLDIKVYVRSIEGSGENSPWQLLVDGRKTRWCSLWNPQHRLNKALYDIADMLQRDGHSPQSWHLSYPYLTLLNATTGHFSSSGSVRAVQFVITASAGYEDDVQNVLFLSHLHKC